MESIQPTAPAYRPRRVLIAVDTSPASENALSYACKLVSAETSVRIVSVVEDLNVPLPLPDTIPRSLEAVHKGLVSDARDMLHHARTKFVEAGASVDTELLDLSAHGGDVVHAIADTAGHWNAELLIIGARQHHGLLRWVEHSVAEPLARNVRLPILIVPESFESPLSDGPRRILFAVDGSTEVLPALRLGARFCTPETHVRAIYVIDKAARFGNPLPFALLEQAFVEEGKSAIAIARRVLDHVPGEKTTEIVSTNQCRDDIAHTIVREANAWRADLLVMGTHGRRGAARWLLGSVASRVARITRTPLLLVNTAFDEHARRGASARPEQARSGTPLRPRADHED
ncbi:universal stress protein [Caballeronia ptereochthonis]|nr:universal stress protein [Caballeronia ptereochthonis]